MVTVVTSEMIQISRTRVMLPLLEERILYDRDQFDHESKNVLHHLALTGEDLRDVSRGEPRLEGIDDVGELGIGKPRLGFIDNQVYPGRLIGIDCRQRIRGDLLLIDADHPTNSLRSLLMGDPKLEFADVLSIRGIELAHPRTREGLGNRVDGDGLRVSKHS